MQIVKADASVTPTVVPWKDKTVRGKLWAILPWVVFGVACVLLVTGLIVHYADGLDGDMASELVLAKMLSEGKGFIITNQWYYSTEIRFLNTQLIFAPLFWLFKSWAVVRIVGTLILNGIMLLAFWFLMASLQRKNLFPWLATLLLLPVSYRQIMNVNFGAYYIPYLAIAFTVLGLIFYALRADDNQKRYWFLVGVGSVLSCLSGIGGFRTIMLLNVPLLAAAVIYWLMNRQTEQKITALKLLTATGIALGVALVGLLINVVILQNCFSFENFGTRVQWREWSLSGLTEAFNAVLAAFGWHAYESLYSVATFGNVVAVIILVLFVVAVVDIIKHRNHYTAGSVLLTLFTVSGLAVLFGLYLTTTMMADLRFTLPITIFALPVLGLYITQHWQWQVVVQKLTAYLKPVLAVVVFSLVLLNGVLISSQFYFANAYPWHDAANNTSMWQISDRLLTAGYGQGYYLGKTECWSGGNTLIEMTDGAIEVWWLKDGAGFLEDIDPWLQPTAHATKYPTGKVFVLIDNERLGDSLPQKITAQDDWAEHCFYSDQYYIVYVYDSVDELRAIVG